MKEEILINVTPREVRAAVVADGVLQEVLIERATRNGLVGNLYKGRVVRVLPGMQAAFVEIGLERTAFLHVSDIYHDGDSEETDVRQLLREGDELLVQVAKEPLGSKGARLSTFIALPSRHLVLLPGRPGVGISARIEAEEERERLRSVCATLLEDGRHGCIVRTAAEAAADDVLQSDLHLMQKLWQQIERRAAKQSGVQLVHADLSLDVRVVRDLVHRQIERVRVDSQESLESITKFAAEFMPDLSARLELYEGEGPIFDLYAIDDEINQALGRKVDLKSGGYLVVEQTEAMTTIDVNTGAFTGRSNLEETVFRTNLEAAAAIARQLRLRNLGGIIILDFIDMQTETHRQQVLEALEAALAKDHARNQISGVSLLGLVEMTRKRTRESLEHVLCDPCPTCEGGGQVKSPETVCYEIFREIMRQHRQFPCGELVILAHDDVVELLVDQESGGLEQLEELTGRPLRLQAQNIGKPDDFDVVPM
jgi:ribonuclease G